MTDDKCLTVKCLMSNFFAAEERRTVDRRQPTKGLRRPGFQPGQFFFRKKMIMTKKNFNGNFLSVSRCRLAFFVALSCCTRFV